MWANKFKNDITFFNKVLYEVMPNFNMFGS